MKTGIFIRQLSQRKHGTPDQAAAKAAEHGVDFVAIIVLWQENGTQKFFNERELLEYATSFHAAGIGVQIWVYPWRGMEQLLVRTLRRRTDELGGIVSGWIIDPEIGYKWNGGACQRVVRSCAKDLTDRLIDAMDESLDIGMSSYGAMHWHHNFPWDVFCQIGWQSPQIYGMNPGEYKRSIEEWRRAKSDYAQLIPAIQAFGDYSEGQLEPWIDKMLCDVGDLDGLIFWSWRQISELEWDTIGRLKQ